MVPWGNDEGNLDPIPLEKLSWKGRLFFALISRKLRRPGEKNIARITHTSSTVVPPTTVQILFKPFYLPLSSGKCLQYAVSIPYVCEQHFLWKISILCMYASSSEDEEDGSSHREERCGGDGGWVALVLSALAPDALDVVVAVAAEVLERRSVHVYLSWPYDLLPS